MAAAAKSELRQALQLIYERRYNDARRLLRQQPYHVSTQRWLNYLDKVAPPAADEIAELFEAQIKVQHTQYLDRLRSEIGGTTRQLGYLNDAIRQAEARYQRTNRLMLLGILALPFFGIGVVVMAYAARTAHDLRERRDYLERQRRSLLDELEARYRQVAAVRDQLR
jgi:hypothetical protein